MPHIKISASEAGNNQGSCADLVNYLEKENQLTKGEKKAYGEREHFFSQSDDRVSIAEVIHKIDHNKAQLGKTDAKFFMLTVNPSAAELSHLGGDKSALKGYVREVMEKYAHTFGKGLTSANLVWYAKLEENRYYKGDDSEVQSGQAKSGEAKPGQHTHVHILVSRKDITNKIKLSPLTAHRNTQKGHIRGGFDRVAFKQSCEEAFDSICSYPRYLEESFLYQNAMKNGKPQERASMEAKRWAHQTVREQKSQPKTEAIQPEAPTSTLSLHEGLREAIRQMKENLSKPLVQVMPERMPHVQPDAIMPEPLKEKIQKKSEPEEQIRKKGPSIK